MREDSRIKFRAWDGKNMITPDGIIQPYTGICYCIMVDGFDKIVEEEKLPIMQFTGLYDKNNQPIYEGDIVRHLVSEYRGYINSVVERKEFEGGPVDPSTIGFQAFDDAEIIGNIYEHPHLLTNNQGPTQQNK